MEGRHGLEGDQVVGVGRSIGLPARRVQDVHRLAQADLHPDGPHDGCGRARAGAGHGVDRVGVGQQLGDVSPGQAIGQAPDVGDRRGPALGDHGRDVGGDPSGRSSDRLLDVVAPEGSRIQAHAEIGEGGPDTRSLQRLPIERGVAGDARLGQRDLDREQRRVDPGQHRDLLERHPASRASPRSRSSAVFGSSSLRAFTTATGPRPWSRGSKSGRSSLRSGGVRIVLAIRSAL